MFYCFTTIQVADGLYLILMLTLTMKNLRLTMILQSDLKKVFIIWGYKQLRKRCFRKTKLINMGLIESTIFTRRMLLKISSCALNLFHETDILMKNTIKGNKEK